MDREGGREGECERGGKTRERKREIAFAYAKVRANFTHESSMLQNALASAANRGVRQLPTACIFGVWCVHFFSLDDVHLGRRRPSTVLIGGGAKFRDTGLSTC